MAAATRTVDKGKRPGFNESEQSETNTYKSGSFTDFAKISASSSHHCRTPSKPSFDDDPIENDDITSVHGESDVDTAADWFGEEQLDELSQKQPSKFKEAMKIEVRPQHHSKLNSDFLFRRELLGKTLVLHMHRTAGEKSRTMAARYNVIKVLCLQVPSQDLLLGPQLPNYLQFQELPKCR